jgi:hypothetical protein
VIQWYYQQRKGNTMLKQHEMPANETAWLIANARKGAVIITRNGERNAYTGHALTLNDPILGRTSAPLFGKSQERRTYEARPTRPMLD